MKFSWNGIQVSGHKLYRAHYSLGNLTGNWPAETITIYARDYANAPAELCEAFRIENDTDIMTDYFERSRIRVVPSHPLYATVRAAYDAMISHSEKMAQKRMAKVAA